MRSIKQLKPTKLSVRLVEKLKKAGVHLQFSSDRYALQGLSPGHWQKSAGAWSWELWQFFPEWNEWRPTSIGSGDRASNLVRNNWGIQWYSTFGGSIEVCGEEGKPELTRPLP